MKQMKRPRPATFPGDVDPVLEQLAWLMDQSIRVGPWRIGLDGFLGLIPGIGDITGGAVSAYIVARAMQVGIPRSAVARMILNIAIDSLLGVIPFVGDIFDFAYKANTKNVQIYRETIKGQREPVRDWAFILLVMVLLAASIALPIIGLVFLARLIGPYMPTF
jgi:hypothetical protein